LDAPDINLTFQFLPVRERDMQKDNPISGHPKRKMRLISARLDLFRLRHDRGHARVRHVSLKRNVRPGDCLRSSVSQAES
jgi:hypothetical protein